MALHAAALITDVHWQALEILSKAVGEHLTGLSQGARNLKLGSTLTRKLRSIEFAASLLRH
eukprot:12900985-Prorocentrum_lima.AAC.1